jgi:hypothetical protein
MEKKCPHYYDLERAIGRLPSMTAERVLDSGATDVDDDEEPAALVARLVGEGGETRDLADRSDDDDDITMADVLDRQARRSAEIDGDDDQIDDNGSLGSFNPDGPHNDAPRGIHAIEAQRVSATPAPSINNNNSRAGKRRASKSKTVAEIGTQLLMDSASSSEALVSVKKAEMEQNRKIEQERLRIEEDKLKLAREVEERKVAVSEREVELATRKQTFEEVREMKKTFPDMSIEEIKAFLKDMQA